MERLKNKIAVVTGGTTGIGRATAEEFINEGAQVIITGRNQATVERAVMELGHKARGIVSDNGKMSDVLQIKNRVCEIFPKIDILFANAGYGKFAPLNDTSEELFDELFDVLVKGTFFTIKELNPLINAGGSVIITTSVVTEYGSTNASVYSAAKAAVQSLAKTLAAEFIEKEIRVNAVSPGYTETEGFEKTGMSAEQITGVKQYVSGILPFKRFATASEVAKVVSFIASSDASYLHGSEIFVDGGFSVLR